MDKKITKWTLKRWARSLQRTPDHLNFFIGLFKRAFPVGADLRAIELLFSDQKLFAEVIKWIRAECHSDPKYMGQINKKPEPFFQVTITGPHILMGAEYSFYAGSLLKAKNRAFRLFKGGPLGSTIIFDYTRARNLHKSP